MLAQPVGSVHGRRGLVGTPQARLRHDAAHGRGEKRLVPPGRHALARPDRQACLDHPVVEERRRHRHPGPGRHPVPLPDDARTGADLFQVGVQAPVRMQRYGGRGRRTKRPPGQPFGLGGDPVEQPRCHAPAQTAADGRGQRTAQAAARVRQPCPVRPGVGQRPGHTAERPLPQRPEPTKLPHREQRAPAQQAVVIRLGAPRHVVTADTGQMQPAAPLGQARQVVQDP